jgi:hypothetical protein
VHIALIGHITQHEMRRHTTTIELANGYLNRILLIACRRQRLLPAGSHHDPLHCAGLARQLAAILKRAQRAGRVRLDNDARELWHDTYRQLAQPQPGIVGQITARAEAHTIRLALIYALTDGKREIGPQHLQAALALHDYAARSAAKALTGATGQPLAEQIHAALNRNPAGLTRSQISDALKHNEPAGQLDHALNALPAAANDRHPDPDPRPPRATLDRDPDRPLKGLPLLSFVPHPSMPPQNSTAMPELKGAQQPRSGVAQLFIPVGRASLWREIEQVPDRLEGADVARILSGVRRCVEELRAPEMADRIAPGSTVEGRFRRVEASFLAF